MTFLDFFWGLRRKKPLTDDEVHGLEGETATIEYARRHRPLLLRLKNGLKLLVVVGSPDQKGAPCSRCSCNRSCRS